MLFQIYAGYGSVFKIYRFQNLPAKNVPFSCEIRRIFYRFQNVPASCERSLIFKAEMLIYQLKGNLDCGHTMPAHFENGEKFDGFHTKTAHFLPADFEKNGRF